MKLCVLGWYGSETLGDRAILDGIIHIYSQLFDSLEVDIGSLFPVLTERTIFEDEPFMSRHANLKVGLFDSRDKKTLKCFIEKSDMVIMGGGPLMDLELIYIIRDAFGYAKKKGKITGIIGCGYGPLANPDYTKCVADIISHSDVTIMRSLKCEERAKKLCNHCKYKIFTGMDPAELSAIEYSRNNGAVEKDNQWIVNIRDLKYVYPNVFFDDAKLEECIRYLSERVENILLLPNHYFSIGGDDRYVMNKMSFVIDSQNIKVQQIPLNLKATYDVIARAKGCIGMRYHSIVFQTYLNGNNYIIDYTNPEKGKIPAFLDRIDKNGFYTDRYINVFKPEAINFDLQNENRFSFHRDEFSRNVELYKTLIAQLLR